MRRIRLTVAYDGTDYCGWQVQNNGGDDRRRIEYGTDAADRTDSEGDRGEPTDAGVHARGNVAVFDTESSIPPERFFFML